MKKSEIFEKIKTIVNKHDPLKVTKGGVLLDEYDPEAEGIALFMADTSNKINEVTIGKRVLFVFKNSFTKATAVDGPYILKRISKDIFEQVKI